MATRPPSLRAIAAFEAAARRQSFTRAAEELNLTQSAVSHAIRGLEERLGVALFNRFGRTVALTGEGQTFLGRVRVGLNIISEAVDATPSAGRARLSVSVQPGFGDRFLAPRLAGFMAAQPGCQLELRKPAGTDELASGVVDVAVRFGAGGAPGLAARMLALDGLIAVAAPGLNNGVLPRWPEDLARFPLIHQTEWPWRLWLEQAGLGDLPAPVAIGVDDLNLGLGLAQAAYGVALAPSLLVQPELRSGRLVRLFRTEVASSDGYHALWNPGSPKLGLIRSFLDWLSREIEASRAEPVAPPQLQAVG
jgi:LysR family glycine cleavage system transcriptional activator